MLVVAGRDARVENFQVSRRLGFFEQLMSYGNLRVVQQLGSHFRSLNSSRSHRFDPTTMVMAPSDSACNSASVERSNVVCTWVKITQRLCEVKLGQVGSSSA